MTKKLVLGTVALFLALGSFSGLAKAQDHPYTASADGAVVSKYIWRGQRLTNDWSFQPSVTIGVGGFAFNTWATMDMTAVNPGDSLPLMPGDGLQGKFSEIDYTFSYDWSFEQVSVGVGTIFYTFPERSASLPATNEIYGSVSLDTVPLAPSFTLYIDTDETNANDGTTGLYFLIGAGHTFEFGSDVFTGIDFSGSISLANNGFTEFYYGLDEPGFHDANFTVSLPISIDDNWSAGAFVTYSALLQENIRAAQFQDPREPVRPTGATYADTVWGGFSISLSF